jgi:hypothetical protein
MLGVLQIGHADKLPAKNGKATSSVNTLTAAFSKSCLVTVFICLTLFCRGVLLSRRSFVVALFCRCALLSLRSYCGSLLSRAHLSRAQMS